MALETRLLAFSQAVAERTNQALNESRGEVFYSWTPGTYTVAVPAGYYLDGWLITPGTAGGTPPAGGNQGGGSGAGGSWGPFYQSAASLDYLLGANRNLTIFIPPVVQPGQSSVPITITASDGTRVAFAQGAANSANGVTGANSQSGPRGVTFNGTQGGAGGNAATGSGNGFPQPQGASGGGGGGRNGTVSGFAGGAGQAGFCAGLGAPFSLAFLAGGAAGTSGAGGNGLGVPANINPALIAAGIPAPMSGSGGGGSPNGKGGDGGHGGPGCGGGGGGAGVTPGIGGNGGPGVVFFRLAKWPV